MSKLNLFRAQLPSAGFSLPSVLIGLGITSLVVFFASRAFIVSKKVKQSIKGSENYEQLEPLLQDSLKNFIKNGIKNPSAPCADLNAHFNAHPIFRPSTANFQSATAPVPAGVSDSVWRSFVAGAFSAQSLGGAALNRCPTTTLGANGRFHYCLMLKRDANATKGSLLQAPLSFVEVSIQLVDLQTSQKLSCSDYKNPERRSAGATVDYLLFWVLENGNTLEMKHHPGTLYVTK